MDNYFENTIELIKQLFVSDLREKALHELSKNRERLHDLAPLLWNSFGVMAIALQEMTSIYEDVSNGNLTSAKSSRVCNLLALLQCVAAHPATSTSFLNANIPLYMYPFLNTTSKEKPYEFLRLTTLGVIGALVKTEDSAVVTFLLSTEMVPLCLRSMENGAELTQTVATFIMHKLLMDAAGLRYVCTSADRFFALTRVLENMLETVLRADTPSVRLLKHIIHCYLQLADNERAGEAFKNHLPASLKDGSAMKHLENDEAARNGLNYLIFKISGPEDF